MQSAAVMSVVPLTLREATAGGFQAQVCFSVNFSIYLSYSYLQQLFFSHCLLVF